MDHKVQSLGEELKFVMHINDPVDDFTACVLINVDSLFAIVANCRSIFGTDVLKDLCKVLWHTFVAL